MTIFEAIDRYAADAEMMFHTPGHKGKLCARDITEIDFGEVFPSNLIDSAQQKTATIYGAKQLRYLTHGSSMGIKAAIMAVGGDILAAANSHQAIFEAAELARVKAHLIYNDIVERLKLPLTVKAIENALDLHSDIKAVVLTSPDYYGLCADIESIYTLVKARGKYLIIDSAHGAHFAFDDKLFPISATKFCDICNLSAHKTMPSYTQSAYLCINNDALTNKVDHALKLLGTTSPSYVLLGGLEYAADYCSRHCQDYSKLKQAVDAIKRDIKTVVNDDFSRIVVDLEPYGLSGKQAFDKLYSCGVVAEMYDERYIVFIVTILDDVATVLKLGERIREIL